MSERKRLDDTRPSYTHHGTFVTQSGYERDFYVTVGFYDEPGHRCEPGEIFVVIAKEGSDLRRFINGWAVAMSVALQHGASWSNLRNKFLSRVVADEMSAITEAVDQCIRVRHEQVGEDAPAWLEAEEEA